ncbi:TfuA-like protein [Sorangium sp. So ce131]|uniref:TfuA-like protein n=1 Tax=Sorangium sp. So ce131 TaxID=3133282 RepID=UPI003F5F8A73
MSLIVFTGPTLSPDEAREISGAVVLPPVSQGDVIRAAAQRPTAIGIIDGYFERIPAVWHKEILWAMSEGIHVFGSASMGALRAAELADFGMEGVGWIFEAFRSGAIEDDDEVAVAHGPAEDGYRACSEAMVNIRRTLDAAVEEAVLDAETAGALVHIAKALPYFDRCYPRVLELAREQDLPEAALRALRAWLPRGKINQKRLDALAMLRAMRPFAAPDAPEKRVDYHFERTEWWERAAASAAAARAPSPAARAARAPVEEQVDFDALLEEVRLDVGLYARTFEGALLRALAVNEASRGGQKVGAEALERAAEAFRRERGLLQPAQLTAWREEHHLSREAFTRLMASEATRDGVARALAEPVEQRMADELRVRGEYRAVVERAARKAAALKRSGRENPALGDFGITEHDLFAWYFYERCGARRVDVDEHMRRVGFRDGDSFRRALLREYAFERLSLSEADGAAAQGDARG